MFPYPNGPFGNMMPYSNLHGMNLDWIIQMAKDFLDQYTHIQDVIQAGLTDLDTATTQDLAALEAKKDRLEGLLNAWYTTHSQDIAEELASALAAIQLKLEQALESLPDDYTELYNNVRQIDYNLCKYNAVIVSESSMIYPDNITRYGITFASDLTDLYGIYHVSGTATDEFSLNVILGSAVDIPDWLIPGSRMYVDVPAVSGITYKLYCYFEDETREIFEFSEPGIWDVPGNTVGLYIQVWIDDGAVLDDDEYIRITNHVPNFVIQPGSGGGSVTNNITQNFETYNVQASPSIVSGMPYFLAPDEDPTTDMTSAIAAILSANDCCHLGSGTYVVSNLELDENQSLIGSGDSTIIKLNPNVSNGYAIKLKWKSTLKDVQIDGGNANAHNSSSIGTRNGIMFEGQLQLDDTIINVPRFCEIDNVFVTGFSGAGLCCRYTSTPEFANLNVSNSRFWQNCVGINIAIRSEYHSFTNCQCNQNYYGVINNGGNNVFANCNFSRNIIGVLMDNSSGDMYNNSHGALIGCKINHNGPNNNGIAIKAIGMTNGFVFSGCNIWYGSLYFENCQGMHITGLNAGAMSIRVLNSVVALTCNMWASAPSISKDASSKVIMRDCFTQAGGTVDI